MVISRFFIPIFLVVLGTLLLFFLFSTVVAHAATLSISPHEKSVPIGDVFTVDIILDTEGSATDGVDIHYLRFDPILLEVQDAVTRKEGIQIQTGSIYTSTKINSVDNIQGTIDFTKITIGGETFTGSDTLATVTFKALTPGTAELIFDFTAGNTRDTNVASAGLDVLRSADGGSYKLGGGNGIISWIGNFFKKLFSFLF